MKFKIIFFYLLILITSLIKANIYDEVWIGFFYEEQLDTARKKLNESKQCAIGPKLLKFINYIPVFFNLVKFNTSKSKKEILYLANHFPITFTKDFGCFRIKNSKHILIKKLPDEILNQFFI